MKIIRACGVALLLAAALFATSPAGAQTIASSPAVVATTSAPDRNALAARLNDASSMYGMAAYKTFLDGTDDAGAPAAMATAFKDARAAWDAWEPGKTPAQVAVGKKLYASWLTYMQTLSTWPGNPLEFNQTPAGIAWTQAMNEYNVDTL